MSTKRHTEPAELGVTHAVKRPLLRNAPRTFDPHNTRDCPQLFADKWTADEE
jgi:hypothetical protein